MQSNGTNFPKIDKDLYWGQSEAQRNQSWELVHLRVQWSTCGSYSHTGLTSKSDSFSSSPVCSFSVREHSEDLQASLRPSTIRVNKHVRSDEAFFDTTVNIRKQTNKHQHSHCQSGVFSIQWFFFTFTTFSIVATYWEWRGEQRNCKITIFSLLASSK